MKFARHFFETSYARVFRDKYTDWLDYKAIARFTGSGRKQPGLVLEVGCGLGTLCFRLADYWTKVIGLDISPFAIEKARQFYTRANIEFIAADGLSLPFAEGVFDMIILAGVIPVLEDDEVHKTYREIHRVLKGDGLLVIDVPIPIGKSWIDIGLAAFKLKNRQFMYYTYKTIKMRQKENPDLDIHHLPAIGDPMYRRVYSTKYLVDELSKNNFGHFEFARRKLFRIIFFNNKWLFDKYAKLYLAVPDIIRKMFFVGIGGRLKVAKMRRRD